ncbi:tetratricopeptide repeat protein [Piscirickettsia salmonis]|uniref:type IV pilus biogenesis/stability protein PilW n=1 Tax=Piscirickettsia salmonis TaxID=1238 RepID=UPI0012BAA2B8|nr:type IV pilus biogenesis/stability protein PilW [Piscirickettsia salmonis]QGP55284.1 tetratricopeptide repeat protein [Piscirickettsia salmonis]QGP58859.1 tetratricopeptide repeat protein [Piscirickettsia salmonis]QGP64850.1 tetratricopeptide repeat protein [Piscirickettsia salmonis]
MTARRCLALIFIFTNLLSLMSCTQQTTVLHQSESLYGMSTVKPDKSQAAHYNVQLGLAYLKAEDFRRAQYKLSKAIKLDPHRAEVHYAFAYYLETVGEFEKAQQEYLTALNIAPDDPKVLNNYGAFLCRQGQVDKSLRYLLAAAEHVEYLDRAGSYENAGLCALKIDELKYAQHYLTQALQLAPHNDRVRWALIKISNQQGQDQQTLVLLKHYLLAQPDNRNAQRLLQQLQVKSGSDQPDKH